MTQRCATTCPAVGRCAPDVAADRFQLIEHPLRRTYAFVYAEDEALPRPWVEAVSAPERVARFDRLLHEQLTPGRVLVESG